MKQYDREELEQLDMIDLHQVAESRNLLNDFDDEDDIDDHLLIGLILDDQHEKRLADEEDADKQQAEDDRNPLINRRDGQDGSDDY